MRTMRVVKHQNRRNVRAKDKNWKHGKPVGEKKENIIYVNSKRKYYKFYNVFSLNDNRYIHYNNNNATSHVSGTDVL